MVDERLSSIGFSVMTVIRQHYKTQIYLN